MKQIIKIFPVLLSVLLFAAGCSRSTEKENEYTLYYVNGSGTRLVESSYTASAQTFDELMEELLNQLASPASRNISALKNNVRINGYERGIDALRIDFSTEYYDLQNTDEVLLRAAVVKTFSQIPGVAKVMITVDQEQLRDQEGQLVPAMDAGSFIDTREGGINSYLNAQLLLYFSDESGNMLLQEERSFHYSSNMVLERVIIEQLIAGPKERGAKAVLTDQVKIQNLYIKDGICTISFDEEANKTPVESAVTPEAALYAIVNSICETCDDITAVHFEIEGDDSILFRQEISLEDDFTMNYSYIDGYEPETQDLTEDSAVSAETEDQPEE